jgi:hypothetical protein
MKTERPPKLRQAGLPIHPAPKPALRLVHSTTPRLPSSSEISQEIKEMLDQVRGRQKPSTRQPEPPEAA